MDASNFQRLIDTWYDPLYRFALSLARNGDDALDLTQQTFARWAQKGGTLRDPAKAKSWLFMVLYREFLDSRRLRRREVLGDTDAVLDLEPVRSNSAETRIDSSAAIAALWELDEIFRVPITLFYLENHSYREIAEILKLPLGTVMSRISRAKVQLREKLQNTSARPKRGTGVPPVGSENTGGTPVPLENKIVPMPRAKGSHHG
jgi:RNA polymerase sigma factor (sigma-70 family)